MNNLYNVYDKFLQNVISQELLGDNIFKEYYNIDYNKASHRVILNCISYSLLYKPRKIKLSLKLSNIKYLYTLKKKFPTLHFTFLSHKGVDMETFISYLKQDYNVDDKFLQDIYCTYYNN